MKWSKLLIVPAFLFSMNAVADIRVSWTPPAATPNAEITEWLFWCIHEFQADGVTPRVYGTPVRFPVTQTEYLRDWYDDGPWKCKVQSYSLEGASGAGAESGDPADGSNEVYFTALNNEIYIEVVPFAIPLPPTNINVETIIP